MAKSKYIEDKQITEISELIYKNIYSNDKAVVAQSPFLSKVVPIEQKDDYIFWLPLEIKTWVGSAILAHFKDDTAKPNDKTSSDYDERIQKYKDDFIKQVIKPFARETWQELGYELKKYDFNQEVPYRNNEFVFIKTSPKRNLFKSASNNLICDIYNVYFHKQLILEGVTPDLRKDSSKRPFVVDWPNKITINYEDDKSTTLWIKDENLYARYVDGINFPTVQTYYYSTSGEEWLEIDDPKPDWLEEED